MATAGPGAAAPADAAAWTKDPAVTKATGTLENIAFSKVGAGDIMRGTLNGQIENLKAEIARLRGSQEQLARDVAEVQKRQRDLAQAADDRIARLEPLKVSLDGQDFTATPDEKRGYDEALALMRTGEFDKTITAFAAFLRRHPGSGYAEAARFWSANALYGKRDYKEAVAAFRAFVTASPRHPRAPEALLALANSQAEMKDRPGARKTIDELMKAYPQSEAAQAGKERLATLK